MKQRQLIPPTKHEEQLRREQLALRHCLRELEGVKDIRGAPRRILDALSDYLETDLGAPASEAVRDALAENVRGTRAAAPPAAVELTSRQGNRGPIIDVGPDETEDQAERRTRTLR